MECIQEEETNLYFKKGILIRRDGLIKVKLDLHENTKEKNQYKNILNENKKEMERTIKDISSSNKVLVIFVIYITGSMTNIIHSVREMVCQLIDQYKSLGIMLQVGFVGYRDYGDPN